MTDHGPSDLLSREAWERLQQEESSAWLAKYAREQEAKERYKKAERAHRAEHRKQLREQIKQVGILEVLRLNGFEKVHFNTKLSIAASFCEPPPFKFSEEAVPPAPEPVAVTPEVAASGPNVVNLNQRRLMRRHQQPKPL